jgi:hypothetical protein
MIAANNFEIKPAMISMLESNQFYGKVSEDPTKHIRKFLKLSYTFPENGVARDTIRGLP